PTIERYFCLTLMISTFYVNAASWMYLSAILEKQKQGSKTSREDTTVIMPTGLVGGTETVLMYSLFFMMPERIAILFSIMSILVGLTICQRLIWATVKL
ncbi:MAG: CDP-alcohol phosphatidyltransferase family protein, partial [Candidatus Poribacteria bacterium]|nr:CDP-alcohol phosphatidyltransferase family protein [Candidatus Poribacteria bacterium]